MIGLIFAATIVCNVANGACSVATKDRIVLQLCHRDIQLNHGVRPKEVYSKDGKQVVIKYVNCEEA